MKNIILITATFLFIGHTAFSQEGTDDKNWYADANTNSPGNNYSRDVLRYDIHGKYTYPVKKEILNDARFIYDFIPGYPTNWVKDYISVEILGTCDGKTVKAVSQNEMLSKAQQNILSTADLASEIVINVNYKYPNSVTNDVENYKMHISMTVLPDKEAEFVGGYKRMMAYLYENGIHKFSVTIPNQFQKAKVSFTVNEVGEIINTKISQSSGDPKADEFLIEVINKMPKWMPAENSNGIKVKQEFEFSVGNDGC